MAADAAPVAYVGLGANLGDAAATVDAAVHALEALPETSLLRRSARYRTPAWGRTDQPDFVNAVVALRTSLPPAALLQALLAIERRFGRDRDAEHGRWGPRRLDLDLLLYGDERLHAPGLTLPHPHLHERAFVLVPLAEIAPDAVVPGHGRVADLRGAVDAAGVEAIP